MYFVYNKYYNRVGLCCTGSSCTYNAETATVACTADPTTTTTTTTTTPTTTTTVSIVIEAATNTITSQSCLTTSGSKCAFPFIFDGKIFTDCNTAGGYAPWCSTKTDANGYHVPVRNIFYKDLGIQYVLILSNCF